MSKAQTAPRTTRKIRFDLKDLPYYAAVFQSLQFAHAGSVYFGLIGWAIGGVGGAITNIVIAAATSRISEIPEKRQGLAGKLMILLYLISPIAIAPAAYITAEKVTIPWIRIAVSVVWAMLPDLSIGLMGAITGKGFLFMSSNPTKPTRTTTKPGKKPQKVARKPITDQEIIDFYTKNPTATQADGMRHFHISHTAMGKRLKNITLPPGVFVKSKQSQGVNTP